jgi:hypothetical protein
MPPPPLSKDFSTAFIITGLSVSNPETRNKALVIPPVTLMHTNVVDALSKRESQSMGMDIGFNSTVLATSDDPVMEIKIECTTTTRAAWQTEVEVVLDDASTVKLGR